MPGGSAQLHVAHSVRNVIDSAVHTISADGASMRLSTTERGYVFVLDHTADASTALDTCDVFVQTKLDGTNWVDVVHFAQHLGNKGVERRIAKILTAGVLLEYDDAVALAAGSVRHAFGDEWRVRVAIVDNSTNASFTFSVTAMPV